MGEEWIAGYRPIWINDREEAIKELQTFAVAWVGSKIEKTYVGWFIEDNSWYEDIPIVLVIGGKQYEICWNKFDDLAITQGQIDVKNCIVSGGKIPMKENALPELERAIGNTIVGVELGESEMNGSAIINSVNLILEGGYLTIYNNLDENGVSSEPCSDASQRNHPIGI